MRAAWGLLGMVSLTCTFPSCWEPQPQHPDSQESAGTGSQQAAAEVWSWRLPPAQAVGRTRPLLMNYHHMALPDAWVSRKEDRLAQWNLLILNHDHVQREALSLARMRQTHPGIMLLAWVPLQGPNDGLAPGVAPRGADDWFGRDAQGEYLSPHWGGHLMNPWVRDYAWPRHVMQYIERIGLGPDGYDGVMIDCLWEGPPGQMDVNRDGVHDPQDVQDWQTACMWLLRTLRQRHPDMLLTGNGGGPWSEACPYVEFANGCMHENALGDQFGGVDWQPMWDGILRNLARVQPRPAVHLLALDVRASGRSQWQARDLERLTAEDLRRLRLGLATSLLLDQVYFGFDRGDCLHGQLWWFDEYDVDLGTPLAPLESDSPAPGVLQRHFTHGQVIVNPTDQAVSVTLSEPLRDASNGDVGCTIIVPPRDARMLVRPGQPRR